MLDPHGIYRHYKRGTEYRILAVAKDHETFEEQVVYQDIAEPEKIWVRPLVMFIEEVEYEGKTVPRFTHIHS